MAEIAFVHILEDALGNSILISGLVIIMMMMIECINIESGGSFFSGMSKSRTGGIITAAILGIIPGCLGGFAAVSLYTHGILSFGALVAMMIASAGDESFVMLATMPDKAVWIFALLFGIAIVTGLMTDLLFGKKSKMRCDEGYTIHKEDKTVRIKGSRTFGWRRIVMFLGVAAFITALLTGLSDHHGEEPVADSGLNLLSEDWMNTMFAILSLAVLAVLALGSDHFINEHLWHHVLRRHLPGIFCWTFGVLVVTEVLMNFVDIQTWISNNTLLMILLATAIGIIPESGPHLIFITLYTAGVLPLPVLLASCVCQDGHASLPLIAESKKSFLKAKAINCVAALATGLIAMLII